jgi:hypothetical protein
MKASQFAVSSLNSFASVFTFATKFLLFWLPSSCISSHCDRRAAGQFVLVSDPHLWLTARFLLLSDICALRVEECPPWREDGSVIYLYNSMSLSGPSPEELMTTSYCLFWDSPNLEDQVAVFISLRNKRPSYTPGHCVPFLSPLTTRRATVEILQSASTRVDCRQSRLVLLIISSRTTEKTPSFMAIT